MRKKRTARVFVGQREKAPSFVCCQTIDHPSVDTCAAGYPGGSVAPSVRKEPHLKRSVPFVLASLLAGFLAATPPLAAPASRAPRKIQLTYHGGPLLQNVQVATL